MINPYLAMILSILFVRFITVSIVPNDAALTTFNSLCEIRNLIKLIGGIPPIYLSILFVRFVDSFKELYLDYCCAFNSLCEILQLWCRDDVSDFTLSILFVRFFFALPFSSLPSKLSILFVRFTGL